MQSLDYQLLCSFGGLPTDLPGQPRIRWEFPGKVKMLMGNWSHAVDLVKISWSSVGTHSVLAVKQEVRHNCSTI